MNKQSLYGAVTVYGFLLLAGVTIFGILSVQKQQQKAQQAAHVQSVARQIEDERPQAPLLKKHKFSLNVCPEEGSRIAKWTGCVRITPTLKPQEPVQPQKALQESTP